MYYSSVVDTFYINEDDRVGIVLDAGWTGGPTHMNDWSLFDLVSVEKFGDINVLVKGCEDVVPSDFVLYQNYPNPFRLTTLISFYLIHNAKVELKIYNSLGRRIKILLNENRSKGLIAIEWDGRDELGLKLSSGIYFYELRLLLTSLGERDDRQTRMPLQHTRRSMLQRKKLSCLERTQKKSSKK